MKLKVWFLSLALALGLGLIAFQAANAHTAAVPINHLVLISETVPSSSTGTTSLYRGYGVRGYGYGYPYYNGYGRPYYSGYGRPYYSGYGYPYYGYPYYGSYGYPYSNRGGTNLPQPRSH